MSRWDDTSEAARQLIYELDELDFAESLVSTQAALSGARAALARVRALHRPMEHGGQTICAECSAYDGQGSTDNSPALYDQCATLRAIGNLEG